MISRLTRREALLRTVALAGASLLPSGTSFGLAAPPRALSGRGDIDAGLQAGVDSAEVPGIVAMVANEHSVLYQGAFGVPPFAGQPALGVYRKFERAIYSSLKPA